MDQTPEGKLKSFWERREGFTGKLVLGVAAGIGLILFASNLSGIINFVQDTIHLACLLGGIGVAAFLLTNKQVRSLVAISFQLVMRGLTTCVVKTNPLAILKIRVQEMERDLQKMADSIGRLLGVVERLKRRIMENAKIVEQSMKEASYANKVGETDDAIMNARKAGRRQRSNANLNEQLTRIETMHRILSKIYKNTSLVIEDTKDEVQVTQDEYEATKEVHSAWSSAMAIVKGNPDTRAIYEMAYDQIADQLANWNGEINQMMEMSEGLMKSIDVQNGMMTEEGLQMLEDWEKKADSWLVDSTKKSDGVTVLQQKVPVQKQQQAAIPVSQNQFGTLFNNKEKLPG